MMGSTTTGRLLIPSTPHTPLASSLAMQGGLEQYPEGFQFLVSVRYRRIPEESGVDCLEHSGEASGRFRDMRVASTGATPSEAFLHTPVMEVGTMTTSMVTF